MKVSCFLFTIFFVSFSTLSSPSESEEKNEIVKSDILETAKLMDEINLLRLKIEKEKLDKSLNEEKIINTTLKRKIDGLNNIGKSKYFNPADGGFNIRGIRILSVTTLQKNSRMVVLSFYGRKYNLGSGDLFKGAKVNINNDNVIFTYKEKNHIFGY